ncbi:hypothetical protein Clacol_004632 [Clathrus columnatus]|uniref:Uncharacterized protein n=1 Tax=Clathrus columnatus TaxID=1419009 RepID=A0AAV5ABK3_9AGAM|nr:hypothetical protein Clacol_004632 [Clathrus columnatus]
MRDNENPSIEQVLPQFGLIDTLRVWENLKRRTFELNEAGAESSTTYRVLFIGRHGERYRVDEVILNFGLLSLTRVAHNQLLVKTYG